MPNHAPTTSATVSRGGAGPADPIAEDNEDQERLAHAELIANGNGDRETPGPHRRAPGAAIQRPLPQRNRPMTKHALTTDATGSAGGAGGSEVIADGHGDRERLSRAREPLAPRSDIRPLRGIAR